MTITTIQICIFKPQKNHHTNSKMLTIKTIINKLTIVITTPQKIMYKNKMVNNIKHHQFQKMEMIFQ